MRTIKAIILGVACLTAGAANAQWVVHDPGNLAQGIINTAKEMVETSATAQHTLDGFRETAKIFEQGRKYYDALKAVHDVVKGGVKVKKSIGLVADISEIYVRNYQKMLGDPNYTPDELETISFGYAKLLSEISRYASGKCDQRVVKTWINESAAMHDFMRSILEDKYGWVCDFTSGSEAAWPTENAEHNTDYLFPVQEHNYMASESASGLARNELLLQYIQELGYDVDFKTSLAKLEKNSEGRITGIIAQSTEDDHFIRYNANKGVLLACGGFPGNPYMMEQLDPLGTSVTTACSYSPADKGYGIRAAVWAGANLDKEAAPMLFDRGVVAPGVDGGYVDSDTAFGGKAFPGKIRQYNPGTQPFLKVNRNGERFANESCPYNDIVYAAAHQPGRVYAQICDANILEDAKRFHTIGCSAQTRNGGEKYIQGKMDEAIEAGALFKCDTLDELADKMGFTGAAKDTFLATVERYNELYDKQNDEDFGKPAYRLSAIRTAPFYGCWLGASLLTTEQGIAINEKGQALDNNNQPMEGLYITGDMSGSFFANNYPCLMAGVAMGRTLTFAMKAVKQMAGLDNA